MKTIRFHLEYACFPLWVYNEQGELIDTYVVPELESDTSLVHLLDQIQDRFNNLYIDTPLVFEYKGFETMDDRADFLKLVNETADCIEIKLKGVYRVENRVSMFYK